MRHAAILATALLLMACSKKDDTNISDTAAGAVAPASTAADTGAMRDSAGARSGAAASPTARGTASGTAGTAGTASAGTGTAGTGTAGTVPNQTQSGVTNAKTGASTLGPNIKKLEPTAGKTTVNREQGVVRDTVRTKTP